MSSTHSRFQTVAELRELFSSTPESEHEALFREVASAGFPLLAPEGTRTTFCLWEPDVFPEPLPDDCVAHLWVNRLTDKQFYSRGLMARMPGTQVWAVELDVPPTLMASYGFGVVPSPETDSPATSATATAHHTITRYPDPHARSGAARFTPEGEPELSAFYGPLIPAARNNWLNRTRASDSPVPETTATCTDGHERPLLAYVPEHREEPRAALPVVFLLDAPTWFQQFHLADVLDWAISAGLLPPLCVAGAGALDPRDRAHVYAHLPETPETSILAHLYSQALDFARESATESGTALNTSNGVIIAGQSMGGLGALQLDRHPARAGTPPRALVISSPSVWWSPKPGATPANLGQEEVDWAAREYFLEPHSSPSHAPLFIDAGAREGLLVSKSFQLLAAAAGNGRDTHFRVMDGGHDQLWWAFSLVERLGMILNASPSSANPEQTNTPI